MGISTLRWTWCVNLQQKLFPRGAPEVPGGGPGAIWAIGRMHFYHVKSANSIGRMHFYHEKSDNSIGRMHFYHGKSDNSIGRMANLHVKNA
jgi:hypothetical protein